VRAAALYAAPEGQEGFNTKSPNGASSNYQCFDHVSKRIAAGTRARRASRPNTLDFPRALRVQYAEFYRWDMDTFEIGDKVVYPNHGVGIIEKISNRLVQGKLNDFIS